MRSFEPVEARQSYKRALQEAFVQAATRAGGRAEVRFQTHSDGYKLDLDEPLLQAYRQVLLQRGASLQTRPTFIGSDTSGFRSSMRAFTISTGVMQEHSIEEYVALDPLEQLVKDTLRLFALWSEVDK